MPVAAPAAAPSVALESFNLEPVVEHAELASTMQRNFGVSLPSSAAGRHHGEGKVTACMRSFCKCLRGIPSPVSAFLLVSASIACMVAGIIARDPERRLCVGPPNYPTHECLDPHSYVAIWVTVVILLALCNDSPPDLTLIYGTVAFMVLPGPADNKKMINMEEALKGFSSPSILAIGGLFVFARSRQAIVSKPCLCTAAGPHSHAAHSTPAALNYTAHTTPHDTQATLTRPTSSTALPLLPFTKAQPHSPSAQLTLLTLTPIPPAWDRLPQAPSKRQKLSRCSCGHYWESQRHTPRPSSVCASRLRSSQHS